MYRQGDVLIVPTHAFNLRPGIEKVARDKGRVVLAYGEATGHAHAITKPDVVLFSDPKLNEMFLHVPTGATVEHDEHTAIELPPGEYVVIRQQVYDPLSRRSLYVSD